MGKIIWKDIIGYEQLYQVSNTGLIKSKDRATRFKRGDGFIVSVFKGKILNPDINKDNYKVIKLCKDGIAVHKSVHRLVGLHFVDNPKNLPCLNHKDTDKWNNNDWNLEWCTTQYNTEHAKQNGLLKGNGGLKGESSGNVKLTSLQVIEIRRSYNGLKTFVEIGRAYNISGRNVSMIINGKSWQHLKFSDGKDDIN